MQYCDRMLHQPQRLHIKKRQQKRTEAQQLVSLQVRQMQLERKRLRVEEEKLECLRGIQSQLTLLHCCSVILWSASCWSSCWSSGCRGVVNLWHCLFWAVNKNMFFFSVLRSTYSHWGCSSCHVVELLVKYWIIPVLVIARVLTLSQHSISVGSIWLDDLWSCGWPSVPALDMYSSLFTFSYLLFCCLCR